MVSQDLDTRMETTQSVMLMGKCLHRRDYDHNTRIGHQLNQGPVSKIQAG